MWSEKLNINLCHWSYACTELQAKYLFYIFIFLFCFVSEPCGFQGVPLYLLLDFNYFKCFFLFANLHLKHLYRPVFFLL